MNVESTLKACYVGPLESSSPYISRKNVDGKTSDTLGVAEPVMITQGSQN